MLRWYYFNLGTAMGLGDTESSVIARRVFFMYVRIYLPHTGICFGVKSSTT